ncbi:MAG: ATP-binding protein, partial [Candidatus Bathyarchaeota archaeon]|nr:ATP-binding protein [Candidatus Bathyarchaeota archaeon]
MFRKEGETIEILCFPREEVSKGDYLLVEDTRSKKSLLAQVIDIQFINFPGLVEELVREEITEVNVFGDDFDPLNLESQITLLKDVRVLVCKIRCSIIDGVISLDTSWLPSRIYSKIYKVNFNELFKLLRIGLKRPIKIGFTRDGSELKVDADALDGCLSIIIGRKGTGKSHLCKLLMLGLVEYGAPCIVFDVNGEYTLSLIHIS